MYLVIPLLGLFWSFSLKFSFQFSFLSRIFQNGVDMDISKMYPPVEFPVSRGTPMISPHIKWNHSQSFSQFRFEDVEINEVKAVMNLRDPNFEFLAGHKIEGKYII